VKLLDRIPHPAKVLRNFLNKRFPPPLGQIRSLAAERGLELSDRVDSSGTTSHNSTVSVYHFVGAGPKAETTLLRFKNSLRQMEIPFFVGWAESEWQPCVHIKFADLWAALSVISTWFGNDPDISLRTGTGKVVSAKSITKAISEDDLAGLAIVCVEKQTTYGKNDTAAASLIFINVWVDQAAYSGASFAESALTTPFVKRMRHRTLEKLLTAEQDISGMSPELASCVKFPIDVVYTWVNDQDEAWQASKAKAAGKPVKSSNGRAHLDERFKNRDELKYSLRSLEMFAPFVRHIHVVTNGQVPDWLDVTSDRISVVTHAEIYKNARHLPTFNSSGIETQLHHVPNLSEHFLYFNDDFMLGKMCAPEDFFYTNGAMKFFPSNQRAFEVDIDHTSEEYIKADANAIDLLKKKYGAFGREIMLHAPYASRKSLLERLEAEFQTEFDACAGSQFRSPVDLRPIAFMQYHAGFQEGIAVPSSITHRYLALWKPTIDKQFKGVATTRKYKTLCINDVGVQPAKAEWTDGVVADFLEKYYPFKSSFEL
jgi:hypothetical protein